MEKLRVIEDKLRVCRELRRLTLYNLYRPDAANSSSGDNKPTQTSLEHVEKHLGYHINSLFTYINVLGCSLLVNGEAVKDVSAFGKVLRSIRESSGMSMRDLDREFRIPNNKVISIEHGRGYRKRVLEPYLAALGIELDLQS